MPSDPCDVAALVREIAAERGVRERAVWLVAERELLRLALEAYGRDALLALRHEAHPNGDTLCLDWVPMDRSPRLPLQRFPAREGDPPLAAPVELSRVEKKRGALARKVSGTLHVILRRESFTGEPALHPTAPRRIATVADLLAAFASVPELTDHAVEITGVVGEIGGRIKVAVDSRDPDVDPVGAMLGVRGARIEAALKTLHAVVDLVHSHPDPLVFLMNALRPCSADRFEHDARARSVVLHGPMYRPSPDDARSDAELRAACEESIRLAGELTGLRVSTSGALRIVPYTQDELGG